MSEVFDEAVDRLDMRSRYGKTATYLIDAAHEAIRAEREEAQLQKAGVERENETLHARITKLEETASEWAGRYHGIEKNLDKLREENTQLRKPRSTTTVDGDTLEHVLSPAVKHERRHGAGFGPEVEGTGLWRLEELESATMHLRMNGGTDDTQVRVRDGVLRCKMQSDGTPAAGWTFRAPQPTIVHRIPRGAWVFGLFATGLSFGLGALAQTLI